MKLYRITVKGKVQGVFYRASAIEKAKTLDVKGYVMNLPHGDVYIEAEGDSQKLQELVDWCKQGPARSKVEEVIIEESEPCNYKNFEVRYF